MSRLELGPIVLDHLATMRKPGQRWPTASSMMLFVVAPLLAGLLAYRGGVKLDRDTFNVSITFFGIFIALLLNIQVAIFAVFQRKWEVPKDEKLKKLQEQKIEQRREALGDFNANLSFLTLFCCVALVYFLSVFALKLGGPIVAGVTIFLYAHFIFTLLACVSGAHTLFQKEYGKN